jgi:hypothetical protein
METARDKTSWNERRGRRRRVGYDVRNNERTTVWEKGRKSVGCRGILPEGDLERTGVGRMGRDAKVRVFGRGIRERWEKRVAGDERYGKRGLPLS